MPNLAPVPSTVARASVAPANSATYAQALEAQQAAPFEPADSRYNPYPNSLVLGGETVAQIADRARQPEPPVSAKRWLGGAALAAVGAVGAVVAVKLGAPHWDAYGDHYGNIDHLVVFGSSPEALAAEVAARDEAQRASWAPGGLLAASALPLGVGLMLTASNARRTARRVFGRQSR